MHTELDLSMRGGIQIRSPDVFGFLDRVMQGGAASR
jgi:hypothetical protein